MERKEFRFSIPVSDQASIDWLAAQDHRGVSLRMLIRQHLAQHGPIDVLSSPIGDSIPVSPEVEKKKKKPTSTPVSAAVPKKQSRAKVDRKVNEEEVEQIAQEAEDDEQSFSLPPRSSAKSAPAANTALSSDALFGYADEG